MNRRCYDLRARQHHLSLGQVTRIMGIVNCTPDSFSQDGLLKASTKYPTARLLAFALKLIEDGADIIDIGGESTRPGAVKVSLKEELRRVIPLIEALATKTSAIISIDTTKVEVARQALTAGASMVNTVKGANPGLGLLKVVKAYDAAIVLMHARGTPKSMREKVDYKDLIQDIIEELQGGVEKCLAIGIKKDRIVLDPGIGFAKKLEHNLRLINELPKFCTHGFPVLIGPSRKSFIGQVLNAELEGRLMGTAASVSVGVVRGAHLVRVHDVKQMKEVALMTDAIINSHA